MGTPLIEEWRCVPGFTRYEVSNLGRLRVSGGCCYACGRKRPKRVLKGFRSPKGYVRANLVGNGGHSSQPLHCLVLSAFVGPRPRGHDGCHNNGIAGDNRLSNLRWDTRKSNIADQTTHGTAAKGDRNGNAKITSADVRHVRAAGLRASEIARAHGLSMSAASAIVTRRSWRYAEAGYEAA